MDDRLYKTPEVLWASKITITIKISVSCEIERVFTRLMTNWSFPPQHWRRVRSRGRRRGHLQDVHHPSQEREAAGSGGGDHSPGPWHQARDVVRAHHQLLSVPWERGCRRRGLCSTTGCRDLAEECCVWGNTALSIKQKQAKITIFYSWPD